TQHGEIAGKFGEYVLAHAIRGAESDLVQGIQHVELGDRKVRESVDAHRVAHDYCVEPAAAPRTSGSRAKFIPELAHLRLKGLGEFRWQRPLSHTRRVRLDDSEATVQRTRRDTDSDSRAARCSSAGRDERIRPVIDVEQRALRSL